MHISRQVQHFFERWNEVSIFIECIVVCWYVCNKAHGIVPDRTYDVLHIYAYANIRWISITKYGCLN